MIKDFIHSFKFSHSLLIKRRSERLNDAFTPFTAILCIHRYLVLFIQIKVNFKANGSQTHSISAFLLIFTFDFLFVFIIKASNSSLFCLIKLN